MLDRIYTMLAELPHDEDGVVYFNTPVKVMRQGLFPDEPIWGACPSPNGEVFLMDADEEWHLLEPGYQSTMTIEAVYERVKNMKQQLQTKLQGEAI